MTNDYDSFWKHTDYRWWWSHYCNYWWKFFNFAFLGLVFVKKKKVQLFSVHHWYWRTAEYITAYTTVINERLTFYFTELDWFFGKMCFKYINGKIQAFQISRFWHVMQHGILELKGKTRKLKNTTNFSCVLKLPTELSIFILNIIIYCSCGVVGPMSVALRGFYWICP